jgi:hypothetical protein
MDGRWEWNPRPVATYNLGMRSARIAIGMLIASVAASIVACRPAVPGGPPAGAKAEALRDAVSDGELESARSACERREPHGCERLELERSRLACAAGTLEGCDHYAVEQAMCLESPARPICDAMRHRGDLPPEPPPLAEAFGCRVTEGPIGPHAVVCLAEDRVSVRDAAGVWDQWLVRRWGREDTVQRAIWVATLLDGPPLWLTAIEVEASTGLCGPVVVRSAKRSDRSTRPVACTSTALHVVGAHGLLRATLGAGDPEAEAALARLPSVEEVCGHAIACERAIAAAQPRPASAAGEEIELPGPPPPGPRTLQQCHARWWSAASAEQALGRTLPAACERLRDDLGGLPTLAPYFDHPAEPPW